MAQLHHPIGSYTSGFAPAGTTVGSLTAAAQTTPGEPLAARLVVALRTMFGLDIRSLAVFRAGLGIIVLMDLFWRSRYLAAHYSDEGVLPRKALFAIYDRPWDLSLHALSGAWQVEAALFAIAAVFAVMLLVGYRTRLATIVSWALLISLQSRNPLVLQGGDALLRCLMFWAMFLPLGSCWSIDRARTHDGSRIAPDVLSIGGAALILQLSVMYVSGGFAKSSPVWTTDGTAVAYALSLAPFSTTLGTYLLGFPALLKVLTFATLYLERFAPFLLFMPIGGGWLRFALVVVFIAFHLALAACLHPGPFPYVCIVGWLALVPAVAWEAAARRWSSSPAASIRIVYDGSCVLCHRLIAALATFLVIPRTRISPASGEYELAQLVARRASWLVEDPAGRRHAGYAALVACLRASPLMRIAAPLMAWRPVAWIAERAYAVAAVQLARRPGLTRPLSPAPLRATILPYRVGGAVAAACLTLVGLWLLRTVEPRIGSRILPHAVDPLARIVRLDQHWDMFAPAPTSRDGWYAIPATLRGGGEVDLLTGGAPMTSRKDAAELPLAQNERWRKYLANLRNGNVQARTWFAQYLLRDWNARHRGDSARQATKVQICFYSQPTLLTGASETKKLVLWTYIAPERTKQRPAGASAKTSPPSGAHADHPAAAATEPPAERVAEPSEAMDEPEAPMPRAESDEDPAAPTGNTP